MITTCEGCGAFLVERTWDRERSFVERYACGSRHRWGEGPEQLAPCPIQRAKEIGAAMERAAVLAWLRRCVRREISLEMAVESIEDGAHTRDEP